MRSHPAPIVSRPRKSPVDARPRRGRRHELPIGRHQVDARPERDGDMQPSADNTVRRGVTSPDNLLGDLRVGGAYGGAQETSSLNQTNGLELLGPLGEGLPGGGMQCNTGVDDDEHRPKSCECFALVAHSRRLGRDRRVFGRASRGSSMPGWFPPNPDRHDQVNEARPQPVRCATDHLRSDQSRSTYYVPIEQRGAARRSAIPDRCRIFHRAAGRHVGWFVAGPAGAVAGHRAAHSAGRGHRPVTQPR